jgi:hypothetical protein
MITEAGAANLAYTYDTRDRLLTAGEGPQSWDDNGNLVARSDGDAYTWDFDDRLVLTKAVDAVVDH